MRSVIVNATQQDMTTFQNGKGFQPPKRPVVQAKAQNTAPNNIPITARPTKDSSKFVKRRFSFPA